MWTVSPCHWRLAAAFCLHETLRLHRWNSSWWTLQYKPGELTRWRICDNVNEGSRCCGGGGGGRSRLWIRSFGSRRVSELAAVDVRDVGYKWGQGPLYIYKINIDVYHKHSSLNAMNMANTFSECSLAFKTWMIWPSPTLFLSIRVLTPAHNTWRWQTRAASQTPDRLITIPVGKFYLTPACPRSRMGSHFTSSRGGGGCEHRLRVFLPHRLFIAHVNQCELKLLFSYFLFFLFLF